MDDLKNEYNLIFIILGIFLPLSLLFSMFLEFWNEHTYLNSGITQTKVDFYKKEDSCVFEKLKKYNIENKGKEISNAKAKDFEDSCRLGKIKEKESQLKKEKSNLEFD